MILQICSIARHAFYFTAKKKTNDPDHPLLHEALAGPDRDKYLEGMEKEAQKLEEKGTWKIVEKSALKPGSNILQARNMGSSPQVSS